MNLKKNLFDTIDKHPSTEHKLNVKMPVMALLFTVSVAWGLYNQLNSATKGQVSDLKEQVLGFKQEVIDLKGENRDLRQKFDSLLLKNFLDKSETNRKLELIIEKQNKQKDLLRK